MSDSSGARVTRVSSLLHAATRQPMVDETWFRIVKPSMGRRLSPEEIAELDYEPPAGRR